jgi:GH15 family glucan-1,4-alpha-glucosidase
MVQLLIEAARNEQEFIAISPRAAQEIVRKHLVWLFERAERPNGYWGRAYLPNGVCKDNVFQLDQQCYPILELCDYYEWTGDKETVRRLLPFIKNIIDLIYNYKDERRWLFQTGETPADDKVDYPYHFSSHILVWHTFHRLNALNKKFPFIDLDLLTAANRIKEDCLNAFVTNLNGQPIFAYLTDLKGNYQCYHDANDLPTVMAPIWGFCGADDHRWLATMNFAFSEDNHGGFYQGKYGGLGSVHTPHPWPLGDAQELLFAHMIGSLNRRNAVLDKLLQSVQWDGLYSEAMHEMSGEVQSRHWFSWPGAFISFVLLFIRKHPIQLIMTA